MAGPYRSYDDVASDDMAESSWLLKVNDLSTHGSFLVNDWVPRGPIMGCHVAPRYLLMVFLLILLVSLYLNYIKL